MQFWILGHVRNCQKQFIVKFTTHNPTCFWPLSLKHLLMATISILNFMGKISVWFRGRNWLQILKQTYQMGSRCWHHQATYYIEQHVHLIMLMRTSVVRFTWTLWINFCGSDVYHESHETLYTKNFYMYNMLVLLLLSISTSFIL